MNSRSTNVDETKRTRRSDLTIFWLSASMLMTIAVAFVVFEFNRVERDIFNEVHRQGEFLFATMSSQVSDSLYFNDIEQIRKDGEIMAQQNRVRRIALASDSGRFLFDSAQESVPSGMMSAELIGLAKRTDTFYSRKHNAIIEFVGAVRFDQDTLGVLYFELDMAAALGTAYASVRNRAVIAIGVLLLLIGLVYAVIKAQQAVRSLRNVESNFRGLIEQSPLPYAVFSTTGYLRYSNPAMRTLMSGRGLNFDQSYCIFNDPTVVKLGLVDRFKQAFEDGPVEFPGFLVEGTDELWVKAVVFPLQEEVQVGHEVVLVLEDISTIKRAEAESRELSAMVLQRQKLEGLGVMARGIAHDFNNLLTPVLGSAGLVEERTRDNSALNSLARNIIKGTERAAYLCDQLLTYGRSGVQSSLLTNISSEVEEILPLVKSSASKKVEFNLSLAKELPNILIDRDQLGQVILNLLLNASESLGDDAGEVSITTGVEKLGSPEVQRLLPNTDLSPGNYVFLKVADTGCGIDAATQKTLFDPFFSTKFPGRGLGMSVVLGIIRDHVGGISVKSEVGVGSTFSVYFPAVEPAAEQALIGEPGAE